MLSVMVNTSGIDFLELPLVYYKGYTATLDKEPIEVDQSENGLIQIPVDKNGKLEVWFGGTFIQKYSIYISIISILVMIGYIVKYNRRKIYEKYI